MRLDVTAGLGVVALLTILPRPSLTDNVVVLSASGYVEGFSIPSHYSAYDKKRINIYLGIPYAKRLEQYDDWRREFRFKVS